MERLRVVGHSAKHDIIHLGDRAGKGMIKFFTDTEEYEKCAYLHKGVLILEEAQIEREINEQFNNTKIN